MFVNVLEAILVVRTGIVCTKRYKMRAGDRALEESLRRVAAVSFTCEET